MQVFGLHGGIINTKAIRESTYDKSEYTLVDPLLALDTKETDAPEALQGLETELKDFVENKIEQGAATSISIFYSDYTGAGSFAINPKQTYYPASLLKVPTMIAYYKISESDPSVLTKQLYYDGSHDANAQEHLRSPIELRKDSFYSVETLIEHMIKYSDNNAAELLINNLNQTNSYDVFQKLFNELGIHQISTDADYLTVKDFSLFFRVLYNATYLSPENSEKALRLLTQTDFSSGIESGVTNNVLVAQKFGEFTVKSNVGGVIKHELHNCGIVYYPHHRYLLCVMTQGNDFDSLERTISGISRTVYSYVEGHTQP